LNKKISRRQFFKTTVKAGLCIGVSSTLGTTSLFAPPARFDIVIKNGIVIDGVNSSGYRADLGITGDRIQAIEKSLSKQAKLFIDASQKIVCPGFIDIHSHSDFELIRNPKAESKIHQGVTTELSGNCGSSPFPRGVHSSGSKWIELNDFFQALQRKGIALNYGTLVGYGSIRASAMRDYSRRPTQSEMATMKEQTAKALRQGAFGLSTGLEYAPDRFSSTDEIIELCRVVSSLGGFYATHMRSEDLKLMEAAAEALHIAEKANIPLQISHLKASGRSNYHKARLVLDLLEKAYDRGLRISADRYPYTAFSTTLSIMFPAWALEGGGQRFCARLQDNSLRQRMKAETLEKVEGNNSWESLVIQVTGNKKNIRFRGRNIREAAVSTDRDPYEFACDLLMSEGGELRIIGFGMSEENTEMILAHPLVMVASDGSSLAPAGPRGNGLSHPRSFGTFPRFLGVYSQERELVSLPEAIKKMTSLPALKIGLRNRGVISKGYYADIAVLDPLNIKDNATYLQPQLYPDGIDHVIVNGRSVIYQGAHTGNLPGNILYSPSYR